MRGTARETTVLAMLGLALVGCYQGRQDHVAGNAGAADDDGDDADDGADDDGADDDAGGEPAEPACGTGGEVLAPMRRLTRLEYDNTIRDLLGDDSAPGEKLTPDEEVAGFAANSVAPLSQTQLDEYMAAAEEVAHAAVTERWDEVVGCDASAPGCVTGFIAELGGRAFRRPLSAAQIADYEELFSSARAEWGDTEAVAAVITAMLMSPHFLYHVEPTTGVPGELVALDDWAVAARLSYFVWASLPDDALVASAEAGELGDLQVLKAHARRMLADPRADAAIASFHRQWLGATALPHLTKDPEVFPEWTPELVASIEEETGRFAAAVLRDGDGTLDTLLTADWTVADAELAQLYGVDAPASGFDVVALDGTERAGLLTQAAFLAANAHAAEVSWVHRGKVVREKMLCNELPPPPPGVEVNEANDPGRLENPECNGCHLLMDPIGTGFDRYSAIGAFRAVDGDGAPIEAEGEVAGVPEIGEFHGAIELAHALADAPQVHACVTRQWLRFATHRVEQASDDCTIDALTEAFTESGRDVRELIVAIVASDAFRFRTQP